MVGCVQRMPDIYLEDLQSQIVADLGVMVSRKLIWQTLRRNSLTMKKVKINQSVLFVKYK